MPRGLSIHIGLNRVDPARYGGWDGPLASCEADMHVMGGICAAQGFEIANLPTGEATWDRVGGAIRDAAARLRAGDTFVLTYAGHGGAYEDQGGDEADGQDETWCLFDGQVLDDELHELWHLFAPGVRVVVVSDSCHSATVARKIARAGLVEAALRPPAADVMPRLMPIAVADRTHDGLKARVEAARARSSLREPGCSLVLMGACQDDELSWGDNENGLFTRALMQTWSRPDLAPGYPALTTAIAGRLTRQRPNCMTLGAPDPAFLNGPVFSL
jgi:hypothetical protein